MKIGILTQPLQYNYGGILQAYALQTYLKRLGHEVWIIDRCGSLNPPFWRIPLGIMKRIILRYFFRKSVIVFNHQIRSQLEIISHDTLDFVNHHIRKSMPIYTTGKLRKFVSGMQFDTLVVGSDQVWRSSYSPCLSNYFLDFLPEDFKGKRVAYAASFGVDEWEFTRKQTKRYGVLLKRFEAVSVREKSGIDLCKNKFGVDAIHLLDPTMLLTPNDYLELLPDKKEESSSKKLLVYILDRTESKQQLIDRLVGLSGLLPFYVNTKTEDWSAPLAERIAPPVEDWLRGFRDADYVVTDSFHGCVFSILFNIPFIVYGNKERGMARFNSLLNMFGLGNRMILDVEELTGIKPEERMDWGKVNRILGEQRELVQRFFEIFL